MLTGLDLFYLCKELRVLVGSKINKVYQPEPTHILFQCHVPSKGKQTLAIALPDLLYLAEDRTPQSEPPPFCKKLRTLIQGGKITAIEQHDMERIVKISVDFKEKSYTCVIELFGKGNFILCDAQGKILLPLTGQTWKDRSVKKGETYQLPPEKTNFLTLTAVQLQELVNTSHQQSLVKAIAAAGLGGKYAEEVCALSGVEKTLETITLANAKKIHAVIKSLDRNPDPHAVRKNNIVVDVLPFPFKTVQSEPIESMSAGLRTEKKFSSPFEQKIVRTKIILEAQEAQIIKMKKKIAEEEKKGEAVYENYVLLKEILDTLNEAKKKMSWREIKEKLQGHKYVKGIDEKTGEITIEL